MMKKIILINIYLLLFLIGVNSIAQQVNVSSLVPKAGNATVYKYLTIKNGVNIGGLMHNVSSAAYGNGNDFSIYTYGSRDLNLRPGNGNINFYPNGNDQKFRFDRFGHFYWAQSRISSDQGGSIELGGTNALHGSTQTGTPYIDFHHKNQPASNSDYSVRLFNTGEDLLELRGGIFRIKTPGTSWATLSLDGREGGAGHEWRIRSKKSNGAGNLDIYNATSQTTALQITPDGDFIFNSSNEEDYQAYDDHFIPKTYMHNDNDEMIEFSRESVSHNYVYKFGSDGQLILAKRNDPNSNVDKVVWRTTGDNEMYVSGQLFIEAPNGPDYVFEEEHMNNMLTVSELETYIKENKHLPGVRSAKQMETTGFNVVKDGFSILEKVEELSLYIIEQGKIIENQQSQIDDLRLQVSTKN